MKKKLVQNKSERNSIIPKQIVHIPQACCDVNFSAALELMFVKMSVPKLIQWFTLGESASQEQEGLGAARAEVNLTPSETSPRYTVEVEPVTQSFRATKKPPMDLLCGTFDTVLRLLFRNRRRFLDLSALGLSIVPALCSDQKSKSFLKEGSTRCGQEEHSREEHSFQVGFSVGLCSVCN